MLTIFMYYWIDSETIHALSSNLWGVFMCFFSNNHAILELCVHIGSDLTCSFFQCIGLSKYNGSVSTRKPNGGLNVLERGNSLTL